MLTAGPACVLLQLSLYHRAAAPGVPVAYRWWNLTPPRNGVSNLGYSGWLPFNQRSWLQGPNCCRTAHWHARCWARRDLAWWGSCASSTLDSCSGLGNGEVQRIVPRLLLAYREGGFRCPWDSVWIPCGLSNRGISECLGWPRGHHDQHRHWPLAVPGLARSCSQSQWRRRGLSLSPHWQILVVLNNNFQFSLFTLKFFYNNIFAN